MPRPRVPSEVGGYRLGRQLGSGSFGEVYYGRRGHEEVAIKLERISSKRSQLAHEWKLYTSLAGGVGIPRVYWHGQVGKYNCMVMEMLGLSLEDLFKRRDKQFSLKTVLMCADQMISRLQHCHSVGIVHRDIKPNNFLIGRGSDCSMVYLVDFGLSKSYVDRATLEHAPYREGRKGLTGTARYTSINNHMGVELSRRDDLEGLGYVLLRMLQGTLPWQGIKGETKELRNERIRDKKMSVSVSELCAGIPEEFAAYLTMCRSLSYEDTPPYDALRRLFRSCLHQRRYELDFVFDWCGSKESEVSTSASEGTSVHSSDGGRSRERDHRRQRCRTHERDRARRRDRKRKAEDTESKSKRSKTEAS